MGKSYICLEEQLAENSVKYIRLIRGTDSVDYMDCTLENGVAIDFNERTADLDNIERLINSPNIKGIGPVVFHGKTGIPMIVD